MTTLFFGRRRRRRLRRRLGLLQLRIRSRRREEGRRGDQPRGGVGGGRLRDVSLRVAADRDGDAVRRVSDRFELYGQERRPQKKRRGFSTRFTV